jgi:heat shock protein HtpX
VVCATTGLLEKLNRRQLEGVIGHELSHIQNYDTRLMAIVVVLVGVISLMADWFMHSLWFGGRGSRDNREDRSSFGAIMMVVGIVFAFLSPIIATIIQLAISRRREFLADASSALLTRYPEGLAQALEIISNDRNVLKTASNATAHLFIANPFKDKGFGTKFSGLFDTHPPAIERIKILRSM